MYINPVMSESMDWNACHHDLNITCRKLGQELYFSFGIQEQRLSYSWPLQQYRCWKPGKILCSSFNKISFIKIVDSWYTISIQNSSFLGEVVWTKRNVITYMNPEKAMHKMSRAHKLQYILKSVMKEHFIAKYPTNFFEDWGIKNNYLLKFT